MKQKINIYYIGYVLSYILFISMFSASYLYFDLPAWPEGLHTIGSIVLIFMTLFSAEFLEIKTYFPKKKILFSSYIFVFSLLAILMSLNTPNITVIFNLFAFSFMILLLILAIKTWKLKKIKTFYYLTSLIIYMPTMALMALTFDGLIFNTDFTRYAFLFGAMIELIFFSLILASKFHVAKYDQIRVQALLIEQAKQSEARLQDELQKQQKMLKEQSSLMMQQSRHAQMGEMIAMIAHQWRQPLAAISAVVGNLEIQLALNEYEKESHSTGLKHIEEYTQSLSKTIEGFKDFFTEDKMPSATTWKKMSETALAVMQGSLKSQKIHVQKHYDDETEFTSFSYELQQALLSIFKNSQEIFLERSIENKEIVIQTFSHNNQHTIIISDNGGGIAEEIMPKIFDPYFSTKASLNGQGLGLYLAKKTIEDHCKGKLLVKNSELDAEFTIIL
jgi:signal transduction histidine kinase